MTRRSACRAEWAAIELVRQWGITSAPELHYLDDLAFMAGALVVDSILEGAQARLVCGAGRAIISVSTSMTSERRRFAIGHELGHLRMHSTKHRHALCSQEDLVMRPAANERTAFAEQQANLFSSAILMPEFLFAPRLGGDYPTIATLESLAAEFATSLTATACRYVRLTTHCCAVIYSVEGIVHWAMPSQSFLDSPFRILGGPVDRCSLAGLLGEFNGPAVATELRSPASAWLADGPYDRAASLRELCWPMPNYRATLSIIQLDSDILDFGFSAHRDGAYLS